MYRPSVTLTASVIFLITLVSSVRADSVHSSKALQGGLNLVEFQTLELSSFSKTDVRDFLAEHFDTAEFGGFLERFESHNGLHPGLFKNGKQFGSTDDNDTSSGAAGNNGKHRGFSVASINPGMKFTVVDPRRPMPSVSKNPEPTALLLLGTGLAGVAALARRRVRRRRSKANPKQVLN